MPEVGNPHSHKLRKLRWGTFIPTLDPLVFELFVMYKTGGQTDGRTKATLIAPFPTVGDIIRHMAKDGENKLDRTDEQVFKRMQNNDS